VEVTSGWEGESEEEILLRRFDMTNKYGPCSGLTRRDRWLRAKKLGLDPPQYILIYLINSLHLFQTVTTKPAPAHHLHLEELLLCRYGTIHLEGSYKRKAAFSPESTIYCFVMSMLAHMTDAGFKIMLLEYCWSIVGSVVSECVCLVICWNFFGSLKCGQLIGPRRASSLSGVNSD